MVDRLGSQVSEIELSKAFHALADPSRRKIVDLLREAGSLRISEIAEAFEMSLNGVSKHLKVLEEAQLINRKIIGREHLISVRWEALQAPYEWLHFYHHFWSKRIDVLADYIEVLNRGIENE